MKEINMNNAIEFCLNNSKQDEENAKNYSKGGNLNTSLTYRSKMLQYIAERLQAIKNPKQLNLFNNEDEENNS